MAIQGVGSPKGTPQKSNAEKPKNKNVRNEADSKPASSSAPAAANAPKPPAGAAGNAAEAKPTPNKDKAGPNPVKPPTESAKPPTDTVQLSSLDVTSQNPTLTAVDIERVSNAGKANKEEEKRGTPGDGAGSQRTEPPSPLPKEMQGLKINIMGNPSPEFIKKMETTIQNTVSRNPELFERLAENKRLTQVEHIP